MADRYCCSRNTDHARDAQETKNTDSDCVNISIIIQKAKDDNMADKKNDSKAVKTSEIKLTKNGKKPRGPGRKFKPNDPVTGEKDNRINRTGQNAKFTEFRHLVNGIFAEEIYVEKGSGDKSKKMQMSQLEFMIREWIQSKDYQKQSKALEYAVGKVPDELHINSDIEAFIKQNLNLFADGQLIRLQQGENPLNIIAELLRETKTKKQEQ
jgi:hypothetical protein